MITHNVEQSSPEWFALRAGIPTASNFSKIVTSAGKESKQRKSYATKLAADMYAGKILDQYSNEHMERGIE